MKQDSQRGRAADAGADDDTAAEAHATVPMYGIKEVARELGITQRTLRFYEDKGLIAPRRVGGMRIYSRREMGRMRLILRGKRLGFTIREIKEFLDLYDADPSRHEQMRLLSEQVRVHLGDLELQREAIETTIAELREIDREVTAWMARH